MSYLHVRLVEAVGLPSTDLLGFADPYCKVFLKNVTHLSENKIFKSEAKKKSTDPIFDCAASLLSIQYIYNIHTIYILIISLKYRNVSAKDFENGLLTIDIYDHDKAKKTDDELGTASLPLSYFKENKSFQGWLPIRSSPHHKSRLHKLLHHKNERESSLSSRGGSRNQQIISQTINKAKTSNPQSITQKTIKKQYSRSAHSTPPLKGLKGGDKDNMPTMSPITISESGTSLQDDSGIILAVDHNVNTNNNNNDNNNDIFASLNFNSTSLEILDDDDGDQTMTNGNNNTNKKQIKKTSASYKKSPKLYRPRRNSDSNKSGQESIKKSSSYSLETAAKKYRNVKYAPSDSPRDPRQVTSDTLAQIGSKHRKEFPPKHDQQITPILNGTNDVNAAPPQWPISPQQYADAKGGDQGQKDIIKQSNLSKQIKFNEEMNVVSKPSLEDYESAPDAPESFPRGASMKSIRGQLSLKLGSVSDFGLSLNSDDDVDPEDDKIAKAFAQLNEAKKKKLGAIADDFSAVRKSKLANAGKEAMALNGVMYDKATKDEWINNDNPQVNAQVNAEQNAQNGNKQNVKKGSKQIKEEKMDSTPHTFQVKLIVITEKICKQLIVCDVF